jgi:putative membrane protein
MYGNHMTTAWWILAGFGGVIVWRLILWAAFSLIAAGRDRRATRTSTADAREVLERRLALGEISLEEYDRIRTALAAYASDSREATPNQPPAATPA